MAYLLASTPAYAMAGEAGGQGSGLIQTLGMVAIIFGIFYFLVIRPQRQQQAEHESMLDSLSEGDRVVTAGGIHGKVTSVSEDSIKLEVAKDFKLTVDKSSVSRLKGNGNEESADG